mgnify:CR=1 FL=1
MRPYFEKMTPIGKALTDKQKEGAAENIAQNYRQGLVIFLFEGDYLVPM